MPSKGRPVVGAGVAAGFTLVELLVVIGIIAILTGFLFPVMRNARRTAIVLASPVAYVGEDDRVHLTDPSGNYDTRLLPVATMNCPVCHSPPAWSPSGQLIALPQSNGRGAEYTVLLDPFARVPTKFQEQQGRAFVSWSDSQRFLTQSALNRDAFQTYEVDVATGASRRVDGGGSDRLFFVAPAPPNAPGAYIASAKLHDVQAVCFLKKDMSPGRVVWRDPTASVHPPHLWPRVDAGGEFVGWSQVVPGNTEGRRIAWKPVNARPGERPTIITGNSEDICFCDWTEDGQILANRKGQNGRWRLVIIDRNSSRILRELPTDMPPTRGAVASWRKYEHR